jgi:Flp pilus assembly protein TadD
MAMVHRDLGVVYAEAGRKEDAEAELLKAIALDPGDVSPHWRLGQAVSVDGKERRGEGRVRYRERDEQGKRAASRLRRR